MNYRYRNGFKPQWYKKENLNNEVNLLKKYFLILILINTIFVPLTIDKLKISNNTEDMEYIEDEEKDLRFIESNDIKFIKLLMSSEFYDISDYKYTENKGTVSFFVNNLEDAEKILLNFKSNNINVNNGKLIPIDKNMWKIEFDV